MPTQFLYIFHCRVSDTIYRRRGWQPTPVLFLAWEIPWTEEPGGLQSTGLQRILEWVATPFTRRSSQPRVQTQVPCIAGGFFFLPPEPPGKPKSVRLDGSINTYLHWGGRSFPGGASGKESTCQGRRQETWVQSLGWEYPLDEHMATHSNILAQRIPWTEDPGGLPSTGLQRVGHN